MWNPQEKSLPPPVSLQRPLLTKLNIMPAGKGKLKDLVLFLLRRQCRVNVEQRGNQLITGASSEHQNLIE